MDDLEFIKKDVSKHLHEGAGYRLKKDHIGDRTTVKIIHNGRVLIEMDEHDWIGLVNEYEGR